MPGDQRTVENFEEDKINPLGRNGVPNYGTNTIPVDGGARDTTTTNAPTVGTYQGPSPVIPTQGINGAAPLNVTYEESQREKDLKANTPQFTAEQIKVGADSTVKTMADTGDAKAVTSTATKGTAGQVATTATATAPTATKAGTTTASTVDPLKAVDAAAGKLSDKSLAQTTTGKITSPANQQLLCSCRPRPFYVLWPCDCLH